MLSPISSIEQKKVENPKAVEVAREYIQKPEGIQRLVFQPTIRALNWAEFMNCGLSATASLYRNVLKDLNQAFFWFDAPNTVKNVLSSVVELKNSMMKGNLWDISVRTNDTFIHSAFAAGLIADSISRIKNEGLIQLSTLGLQILDATGFLVNLALFMTAMKGIKKQLDLFIHAEIGSSEFKLAFIKLVAQVSLMAIALFGMYNFAAGVSVVKWLSLSVSTSFLVFILWGYFYDKMYIPK